TQMIMLAQPMQNSMAPRSLPPERLRDTHWRLRAQPGRQVRVHQPLVVHTAALAKWIRCTVDMYGAREIGYFASGQQVRQGPRPTVNIGVHRTAQWHSVFVTKSHRPVQSSSIGVGVN